jgi:hypothetical protein
MKKLALFSIFSILLIFSIQQISFGEDDTEEDRQKAVEEAHKKLKRQTTVSENEVEEVKKEKKIIEKPSELKKLLPTEKALEEITYRTIWKYINKESILDEEVGIEVMSALLKDITRIYDPIVDRYKVSTITIEIIKYDDKYEMEYYWDEITNVSIEKIFNNAYLIGSPTEDIDCMFNFSAEGAVTICKTDEYVIQSVIFDKYQEHYGYNKLKIGPKKFQLNQDEMTTRIVQEILKNIQKNENIENNFELYKILKSNKEIKEKNEMGKEIDETENKIKKEQDKNIVLDFEKDKKYGIQKFSCVKDDFGLITISGQFNNNGIKKDKVVLEILFLDYEQNIIFKNTANLLEIKEFETKRFLGNTKVEKSFSVCTIKLDN